LLDASAPSTDEWFEREFFKNLSKLSSALLSRLTSGDQFVEALIDPPFVVSLSNHERAP